MKQVSVKLATSLFNFSLIAQLLELFQAYFKYEYRFPLNIYLSSLSLAWHLAVKGPEGIHFGLQLNHLHLLLSYQIALILNLSIDSVLFLLSAGCDALLLVET